MKVKFWLEWEGLIIVCIGMALFGVGTIVFGSLIPTMQGALVTTFIFVIMFLVSFLTMFIAKRVLSKIVVSDEGIEWVWLRKQVCYISWDEVTDVRKTKLTESSTRGWRLSFFSDDKEIKVCFWSKKMYNAIMILCPYQSIKNEINKMNLPLYFNREDYDNK